MAKELPYFQFEPAEYLTKDISFCSLEAQGLFINICAYYWQRTCELTKQQLLRRLNHPDQLEELISEKIISIKDDKISIKFLDKQRIGAVEKSRKNSINGRKGGNAKKRKPSEIKPNASNSLSENQAIRKEEIKEDKIKEDVYYTIQDLKIRYFKDKKIVGAVILNPDNKFKNEKHLELQLEKFVKELSERNEKMKTESDFAFHFRNWNRKQKPESNSLSITDGSELLNIKNPNKK